jgi:hypothetical protein
MKKWGWKEFEKKGMYITIVREDDGDYPKESVDRWNGFGECGNMQDESYFDFVVSELKDMFDTSWKYKKFEDALCLHATCTMLFAMHLQCLEPRLTVHWNQDAGPFDQMILKFFDMTYRPLYTMGKLFWNAEFDYQVVRDVIKAQSKWTVEAIRKENENQKKEM